VGELRGSDLRIVAEQLGREPTVPFIVVARCPGGHPLVTRNRPFDAEGTPFPTLFWLTCPAAVRAVSRLESAGAIAELNERIGSDADLAFAVERAHAEYARERARDDPRAEAFGGVGGTRTGLKCLHAHYANHLAGGDDAVGRWTAERVEPVHPERPGRVAAIDQGTNSIRLLVAEPLERGGFEELARDMVITRLGKGVDETGRIAPETFARTATVFETYVRRARALHAERVRVGATAVLRDASNGSEYERLVEKVAAQLEVLSGEREAELSFLGATCGLETADVDASPPYLALDIGGGSTEFVLGADRPTAAISTQMGSVRLTERFVEHDPIEESELAAMTREVGTVLDEVERAIPVPEAGTLVAVAGTSTTVQAIALGLGFYDPERIHRTVLARADAERVLARLSEMTIAERAVLPVMAPGRADVIVAGATILLEAMRRFGFERAIVSESDILDGLVLEMLEQGSDTGPPSSGTTEP
jgi:exopolyphosphatase / guanosine-5'-triphosphate,3'-diphosphate pyrophosphatase